MLKTNKTNITLNINKKQLSLEQLGILVSLLENNNYSVLINYEEF